ncbi:MAG: amino acid permease [Solirubrobacteraceae bacterium]|nr:amino acid permease [Solirubrobacteraceae bacterium]
MGAGSAGDVRGHAASMTTRGLPAGRIPVPAVPASPLNRAITRPMLLVFIVGDVLGAGIYALVGEVAGKVGGAVWASFLLALFLALFTAFAYAELVTKFPRAGGAAVWVNGAFKVPFFTFMVAFAVMMSGITSASTLARAFGGDYLAEFVDLPVIPVAIGFVVVVALINFRGISESVKLNLGLTGIECIGLLLVVVIGVAYLADGGGDPGRALDFKSGEAVPLAILSGAALAFYALIGFEDSVNVAEETKEPERAYPLALFGGLLIAGVIYLAVTVVASMVVPTNDLVGSSGPLLEVVDQGPLSMSTQVFSAIALLAVANGALINMIMASRITYGMAGQGIVPPGFGRVHERRRTPWVAILFTSAIAIALVCTGDLSSLADTTVLLLLAVFVAVNIAVLVLRRTPVDHEHFHAPTIIPVIGAIVCLGLMTQKSGETYVRAGILLAVGVVLWLVNRYLLGGATEVDAAEIEGR